MHDGGTALDTASVARLNALLGQAERALAPPDGLSRRPWYRQLLSAPGWYTGYSPKTMPAVREAIEDKRWKDAEAGAVVLGQALERQAGVLVQAAGVLAP
jgi:N-acetylated-alpha-linked acidic dipeptidase